MAVEIRHFKQDYQSLKREVSRLASMANKRLVRLENNGFEDSPAYKQWIESGGEKFSVRGKDYNALQKELARVRQFVNAKTSTIRGAQSVLKAIAANTGANFKGKELWAQASNFFRVASMIEQYIRNTEDVASAIGYQKIWTAINQYTQANNIDLAAMQVDMEQMVGNIAQMIGIEATNTVVDPLADMLGGNYVVIK
jgi:hypothetical protein